MSRAEEYALAARLEFRRQYACDPHERPDLVRAWCDLLAEYRPAGAPGARDQYASARERAMKPEAA